MDPVSEMYLLLERIGRDSSAVQRSRVSIATFFLQATRIEILNESQQLDWQPDITRFLRLWDLIELANPMLAVTYLDAFLGYVNVDRGRVTERPGSEQGARVASLCLLRALAGVDSGSATLKDIRERYVAVIPSDANFEGLLCYHVINVIHVVLVSGQEKRTISWRDYGPHAQEHVFFANTLAQVIRKGKQGEKVPRWALRFATHSLSHNLPPTSVVTDGLTIIAIDLGCDVPHSGTSGRYVDP